MTPADITGKPPAQVDALLAEAGAAKYDAVTQDIANLQYKVNLAEIQAKKKKFWHTSPGGTGEEESLAATIAALKTQLAQLQQQQAALQPYQQTAKQKQQAAAWKYAYDEE